MHLVAIRRDLYERERWIARSLYDAFVESEAPRASAHALRRLAECHAALADR